MVKILRPKLDAVCGSGVVVEIYLVAPVLNARTIVGRIFVSKVCIVGEAGRRVVGMSIGIELILVAFNKYKVNADTYTFNPPSFFVPPFLRM